MFKISTNSPFLSFIMKSLSLSVNLVNKADRLYQRFLKITVLGVLWLPLFKSYSFEPYNYILKIISFDFFRIHVKPYGYREVNICGWKSLT